MKELKQLKEESFKATCPECGKVFKNVWRHFERVHEPKPKEKTQDCLVCNKVFTSNHHLKMHMKVHGKLYLSCNDCDEFFLTKYILKTHMKEVHFKGDGKYKCSDCGKTFSNNSNLNKHKKSIHEGLRFLCKHCERDFTTYEMLKYHTNALHNGGNKLKCIECNKKFVVPSQVKKHMKLHQSTREKLVCPKPFCTSEFTNRFELQKHVKSIHQNEKLDCNDCGKKFLWPPSRLRFHMKTVHGNQKFICTKCSKEFKWKYTFKNHINSCEIKVNDTKSEKIKPVISIFTKIGNSVYFI